MTRSIHYWASVPLSIMAIGLGTTHAATVEVGQRSEPAGIVTANTTVETPCEFLTSVAPSESLGYSFTHWTINGSRADDSFGSAKNPVRFMVYEAIDAVAHYVPTTQDDDSDGIPDWYEIKFNGSTNQMASADADGDGLTLSDEYRVDFHPAVTNSFSSGGISMRNSELMLVNLSACYAWSIASEPSGLIGSQSGVAMTGTVLTTANLGPPISGYEFGYWTLNGVRQSDAMGIALSKLSFIVTTTMTAVAKFYPSGADTDTNNLPDWWEYRYFGALGQDPDDESRNCGLSVGDAYRYDCNPVITNSFSSGGISMRNSELTMVNLAGFYAWSIASEPSGLIGSQSGVAMTGTVLTTANLGTPISGYEFGYWTLNGVRQSDAMGIALSKLSFTVTTTMTAVAKFYPSGADTDTNNLPDWWEYRYFGALGQDPDDESRGCGLGVGDAYRYDCNPVITNSFFSGGVSMRNSERVTINLQPFERVEYAQTDGTLTNMFSTTPTSDAGLDFGNNSMPAIGDWDGDGDQDVFVGSSGGVMRVYENIGTRNNMNLADRTLSFWDLSNRWSGIVNPYPALGDWGNDGKADLALGGSDGTVRLISSTTNFAGSHVPVTDYSVDTGALTAIPAFARLAGENRINLLVLLNNGTVRAYHNTGGPVLPYDAGTYTNDILKTIIPSATGLSSTDISGDGLDDILVSDAMGRIWEFHQTTNRTFVLHSRVWAGTCPGFADRLSIGCGDLDGDGDTDALCGYDLGGVLFLRDPRIGVPSGLIAHDGAESIRLSWDPSMHYRFRGFYVYRAPASSGTWARVTNAMLPTPEYEDGDVVAGIANYYNVTALGGAMYPGNTVETLVETRPSETVSAKRGKVVLWMSDYNAQTGTVAILKLNAYYATGVAGTGMDIRILYDPLIIKPVSQVIVTNPTVELTAVSQGLTATNNAMTANGELQITGLSGALVGEGHIFDVKFAVSGAVAPGTITTNTYSFVHLESETGVTLDVDASSNAVLTVTGVFVFGDVDGDGVVDHEDCVALQQVVVHRGTPIPSELEAGDMDGNGYLDHNDFKLLHAYHVKNK